MEVHPPDVLDWLDTFVWQTHHHPIGMQHTYMPNLSEEMILSCVAYSAPIDSGKRNFTIADPNRPIGSTMSRGRKAKPRRAADRNRFAALRLRLHFTLHEPARIGRGACLPGQLNPR